MKLSARTRYATRLLVELANHTAGSPVSAATLSQQTGVTVPFIEQIIRPLKQEGLITSVRGAHGGHKINTDPKNITLNNVVEIMEGHIELAPCLQGTSACPRTSTCTVKNAWDTVTCALKDKLESISIADLLDTAQDPALPLLPQQKSDKEEDR